MPPLVTLFTVPRAFQGHFEIIQRNAIQSWTQFGESCRIVLIGDDDGVADIAREYDAVHIDTVSRNHRGTPLLDDVMRRVEEVGHTPLFTYVNADIILLRPFVEAVLRVAESLPSPFVMVGRRWDVDIRDRLDFSGDWTATVLDRVARTGTLHAPTGIDYFVFPPGLWPELPPFAIGRTIWDQWLLYSARASGADLIDATAVVTAVHQNHPYPQPGGKTQVWEGDEARRNLELAGGRNHMFTIEDATLRLSARGLHTTAFSPPFRRRLEVHHQLRPGWRWFTGPLRWLVATSYGIRKRLGLAHVMEKKRHRAPH